MTLVWLVWFLAGESMDILTTHAGLKHGNIEINPLMAKFGEPGMYILKAMVVLVLSVFLWRYGKSWAFFAASVIIWMAVLNNTWRLL